VTEKKIGILGGTFNPVHNGHMAIARYAVKRLGLDRLYFVPTYLPPHKKMTERIPVKTRVLLVRMAIRGKKAFGISLYEARRPGKSYSIYTLRYFRKKFGPRTKLFFIIGADSLGSFDRWKNVDRALGLAQFVVISRPGADLNNRADGLMKLAGPRVPVSSSMIRGLCKEGRPIGRFVPAAVWDYINKKGLYRAV